MFPLVEELILIRSVESLTSSGLENLDQNTSYLFISNHRDIILDSTLMNYLILKNGMNATEIAIGDNLLIEKWIEYIVKLNRSFVVRRNLPAKELLQASKKLSEYIRFKITKENTSVWLAQREGRVKNGNDKTQPSLLKMLNLSNTNSFVNGFNDLRIVPLSISYEIEPCGISKVAELYKNQVTGYKKTQQDDLKSMEEGLVRSKGHIHFGFGQPISLQAGLFTKGVSLSLQINNLVDIIDRQIYRNYKLWPNNYIAEDILNNSSLNSTRYTPDQLARFITLLDEAINIIPGDSQTIKTMFLKIYVSPVINKRKKL